MGDNKQRLRPWLEAQINGGQVDGVCWINREKTRFKIPWRHGGTQNWTAESSQLFMEWAKHTGRYREGVDEPDWVTWKTRLRCALHKAADILEIKAESKTEIPESFKVYEFKPQKNSRVNDQPLQPASPFNGFRHSTAIEDAPSEAPIPVFLNDYMAVSEEEGKLPSDLDQISASELLANNPGTKEISLKNISIDDIIMISDRTSSMSLNNEKSVPKVQQPAPVKEYQMVVTLVYGGKTVVDKTVETSNGCRLYYGSLGPAPLIEIPPWMHGTLYGRPDSIHFPPCGGLIGGNEKQEHYCQKVLEKGLASGILLKCHESDIYAYRLCQCSIFYVSAEGTRGAPVKLNRDREDETGRASVEKIFDYYNNFLPALTLYNRSRGPRPDPYVYLLIGAQKTLADVEKNLVLMYVKVATQRALNELLAVEANQKIPSLQFSNADEIDELLQEFNDVLLQRNNDPTHPTPVTASYGTDVVDYQPPSSVYQQLQTSEAALQQQAFGVDPDFYDAQFTSDTLGGSSQGGHVIVDDYSALYDVFGFPPDSDQNSVEQVDDFLLASIMDQIQDADMQNLLNSHFKT